MTDTDSSNTDPMAAARRLLGAETSADTETAAETDGGVVETDQSEAAAVDTEIIDEDELLEETTKELEIVGQNHLAQPAALCLDAMEVEVEMVNQR